MAAMPQDEIDKADLSTRPSHGSDDLAEAIGRHEKLKLLAEQAAIGDPFAGCAVEPAAGAPVQEAEPRLVRDFQDFATVRSIHSVIDLYLQYFFVPPFKRVDRSTSHQPVSFSKELFGQKQLRSVGKEDRAQRTWVCDKFLGAKDLEEVAHSAGPEACLVLNPNDNREIRPLEEEVLHVLKKANAMPEYDPWSDWELVRLFLKEHCSFLTRIRKSHRKVPLPAEDGQRLSRYLKYGTVDVLYDRHVELPPKPKPNEFESKRWSFGMRFFPDTAKALERFVHREPLHVCIARLLAAPVAFQVCREMAEFAGGDQRKKFIRKCHSPDCDKFFYSSRADAKCCESTIRGRASKCKTAYDNQRQAAKDTD